ncbi:MAG TPA: WbqC family protein [Candidatus Bathyarchaeia archaeon]|nr:WbqC family protein [Candidatus Bathyarchaeia archaeon]
MKVAIHQPQYLPYPGFFHKLSLVDALVVMDDVQYDKRFTNRNQILGPHGPIWLTVPIVRSQKFHKNMDVEVNNSLPWRTEHWKKMSYSYRNAGSFHEYGPYFESLYKRDHSKLVDLDLDITRKILDWLDIRIEVLLESDLKVEGEGTQRLVNACLAVGADSYVSGIGGKNYVDEGVFATNHIGLEYQEYQPKPYRQRFVEEFVPNLSVVDMLFNVGPKSRKLIAGDDGVILPRAL